MARIRTIKPEFFTSESVLSLSPHARLFFIGLWCESDREGRMKWKPKTLKFRYLPADNIDINKLAQELIDEDMIVVYQVGDVEYCEIPSFTTHQVINNRERESEIPPRDSDASITRELPVKAEGKGRKGKEGKGTRGFVKPSPEEAEDYFKERGCLEKGIGQRFVDHYDANGWMRGNTKVKDWKATIRTWCGKREQNQPKQAAPEKQMTIEESQDLEQKQRDEFLNMLDEMGGGQ